MYPPRLNLNIRTVTLKLKESLWKPEIIALLLFADADDELEYYDLCSSSQKTSNPIGTRGPINFDDDDDNDLDDDDDDDNNDDDHDDDEYVFSTTTTKL